MPRGPTARRPDGAESGRSGAGRLVKVPGPVAILGVERAAHDQHRGTDVVAGPARVARAPPLVVVGMFGHLLPERIGCQQFRQVSPRGALREEERAFVGRDRQPAPRHLVGRLVSSGRVHRIEEPHGVAQHQHAVVVHVVAHVPVRNGGLRRNGLHGPDARLKPPSGRRIPGRSIPRNPTRPLLPGMFFTSQSTVS